MHQSSSQIVIAHRLISRCAAANSIAPPGAYGRFPDASRMWHFDWD